MPIMSYEVSEHLQKQTFQTINLFACLSNCTQYHSNVWEFLKKGDLQVFCKYLTKGLVIYSTLFTKMFIKSLSGQIWLFIGICRYICMCRDCEAKCLYPMPMRAAHLCNESNGCRTLIRNDSYLTAAIVGPIGPVDYTALANDAKQW